MRFTETSLKNPELVTERNTDRYWENMTKTERYRFGSKKAYDKQWREYIANNHKVTCLIDMTY